MKIRAFTFGKRRLLDSVSVAANRGAPQASAAELVSGILPASTATLQAAGDGVPPQAATSEGVLALAVTSDRDLKPAVDAKAEFDEKAMLALCWASGAQNPTTRSCPRNVQIWLEHIDTDELKVLITAWEAEQTALK